MQDTNSKWQNRMWWILAEALCVWFLPAILVNIFGHLLSSSIRYGVTKGLLIFTIIDVIFCVCYIIKGFIDDRKNLQLNIEQEEKIVDQQSTLNKSKGDLQWQEKMLNLR